MTEISGVLDPALDRRIGIRGIGIVHQQWLRRSVAVIDPRRRPRARAIFALDPRLLPGAIVDMAGVDAARWNAYRAATRNSLRALSEQNGGFALEEGQDLAAILARMSDLVRQ